MPDSELGDSAAQLAEQVTAARLSADRSRERALSATDDASRAFRLQRATTYDNLALQLETTIGEIVRRRDKVDGRRRASGALPEVPSVD